MAKSLVSMLTASERSAQRARARRIGAVGLAAIAGAAVLAASSPAARANILTQTDPFSITQINPNEATLTLAFSQLSPTVGTLSEVAIGWGGKQEEFATLSSVSGGAWDVSLLNDLRLSDSLTFDLLANAINPDLNGVLGVGGESPVQGGPFTITGGTGTFSTDNTLFQGAGTVDLTLTEGAVSGLVNSGPADLQIGGGTSDSSGTVQLSYIYTPAVTSTPEPGSLSLLAMGLLGIGAVSWRRRAP